MNARLPAFRVLAPLCITFAAVALAACDGGDEAEPTFTASPTPPPSPTAPLSEAPYADFIRAFEAAFASQDAAWFADHLAATYTCGSMEEPVAACEDAPASERPPAIAIMRWDGDAFLSGRDDFEERMTARFGAAVEGDEDDFGPSEWRVYAIGEQRLPNETQVATLHIMTTAVLDTPERGRWAFVFEARRSPDDPEAWQLARLLQVPPTASEEVLALGPITPPEPDPATVAVDFSRFLESFRDALDSQDAEAIAGMLATSPVPCPGADDPLPPDFPACADASAGTSFDALPFSVYCLACDAGGYATADDVTAWLTRWFSTSETAAADEHGAPEVQIEAVRLHPEKTALDITLTGVGRVREEGDDGRWVVTFQAEPDGGDWHIVSLTLGPPADVSWLLPTLRGTNIAWTRCPCVG